MTDVFVTPNVRVKRGDVLFKIGPKTYQFAVDQKKALLAELEQAVKQLKASYDQASAVVEMARAQFELAQQNYDRQLELFEKNVIARASFDTTTHNVETARQALAGAEAAAERALLVYSSEIGGVNTTVARLQAELGSAEARSFKHDGRGADRRLCHPAVPSSWDGRQCIDADYGVRPQ